MSGHRIRWVVVSVILYCASYVWGETDNQLTVESMIGKYVGVIQVVNVNAVEHPYLTEVLSVENNAVSLSAVCPDCANKRLKRTDCKITEASGKIIFVCKGPVSDEVYTYNGIRLRATGFGNRYPYTINVTKIVK
jgi:excinuclease UvrABC ATPase subunit